MAGLQDQLQTALGDRYQVEQEIGQGGMAVVFRALDRKHDRMVAVKVLRPELAAALGHERFLREIEIAAKLQHPHILPVYDSGRAGGLLYYVMPYVEGESLRDRLERGGSLPGEEAVRVAREVGAALDYAHRRGIVHRDIKPANVLLSDGHAVVADFGIARAVSAAQSGLTQAGTAIGTPTYMSPEQALGEQDLDGRTDVYALGCVLYEMLTGKPPHEGATPQTVIAQTLAGKAPKLASDPLGLEPVIRRALARERDDRFPTAGAFSGALDGISSGVSYRFRGRRRRAAIIAGATVIVAAVLAVLLWPRGFGVEGNPRQSLIIFPFENRTGDASRDYLQEAAMNLLGLAAAHWQDMRVYDDERTASLMRRHGVDPAGGDLDFEAARAMAREAHVGTLVVGDIRREGDSLAIEAKVHDVRTGERLATYIARAPWDADPRPLFDQLAGQILGTSGAPPGERPSVLAQTTTSIEAYRAYLAGTAALQRFQIDSARQLLERAVSLDSSFALAYLRLVDVQGWAFGTGTAVDQQQVQDLVLAAERHSASLPPRLRGLVAYHRAYEDGDLRRARRIAAGLIAHDSTDVEAWYQFGEAHFHDNSTRFPHADTAGNLGIALRAFQRTLALDSSYILAYQHIIDALRDCTGSTVWVCLADSAVYGTPEELARLVGPATIERLRTAQRREEIATARGWISAAPGTSRAHLALVQVLAAQDRYDDALAEAERMAQLGWTGAAAVLKGQLLVMQGRPGAAAATIDSALHPVTDPASMIASAPNLGVPVVILVGGGGRLAAGQRLADTLFGVLAADSGNGPGGLRMSEAELRSSLHDYALMEVGSPAAAPATHEMLTTLENRFAGDSVALRRWTTVFGAAIVEAYLASRDTTLLVRFLALADTANSSTWRVADAQLALDRGDTARARRWTEYLQHPSNGEFRTEAGIVRAYAWGDLLARLGRPREALAAYARIDSSDSRPEHVGFWVRSWPERGALLQQLGDVTGAIAQYERFIEAWKDADPEFQPLVERARNAVAALRGEVRRQQH